jgi:hypothetical protein
MIPMKIFRDLEFEFQLDPFAFFSCTSSNKAITSANFTSAWTTDAVRSYKILSFQIVVDMVLLDEQLENSIVQSALQEGVVWNTNSWATGPQFICENGKVPPTCQINLGFTSLKSIIFGFNNNDFNNYAWVRKFYRHSMCITTLQLKIGVEYTPPQPISGNSGNSCIIPTSSNVKVTNKF